MANGPGFTISTDDGEDDRRGPPQRDRIVAAVINAGISFWCDLDGYGYATVPRLGHIERHRVRSRRFDLIVRGIYGAANPTQNRAVIQELPGSISGTAMAETVPQFEAMAQQNSIGGYPEVRVIRTDGSIIWLDLGDADWTTIRIDADGWRPESGAHLPLVRPDGMRALPTPVRNANALANLRGFLNVKTEADFVLIVSWLVAALYPEGPYSVLALDGEQGSGKSTVSRMLRRLVDPNKAEIRAAPRTEDDLLIAAVNGRVVALDNVSSIESYMADAICRLATGAGFAKRKLYTDGDEIIVSVVRPVLLNGIPSLLARGDLADRAVAITLEPIPDEARRQEKELWEAFGAAAPGILALLLDGLAMALRNLPTLQLNRLPRMADFARVACAAAPAFGWTAEMVLSAIEENRGRAVEAVLDADAIADALRNIVTDSTIWIGTATALLEEVNRRVPPEIQRERGWPKDGARLSARLTRIAPALRRAGVDVIKDREAQTGRRMVTIRTLKAAESASPSARDQETEGSFVDADRDAQRHSDRHQHGGDGESDAAESDSVTDKPATANKIDAGDAGDADLPPPDPGEWEATL